MPRGRSSSSGVLTHLSSPPACHRTETWPRAAGAVPAALVGPLSVSGATTCNALHFASVDATLIQIPKNAGSALATFLPKLLGPPRRIAFDDKSWRTAYVFAFARDVFVRAASAHAYLDRNAGAAALFGRFCANPLKYLRIANTGQSLDAHQRHTATQSGCIFAKSGEPAVDFVGAADRMHEDAPQLLYALARRGNASIQQALTSAAREGASPGMNNRSPRSFGPRAGDPGYRALYKRHPECCRHVERWYSTDVKGLACRTMIATTQPDVWASASGCDALVQ